MFFLLSSESDRTGLWRGPRAHKSHLFFFHLSFNWNSNEGISANRVESVIHHLQHISSNVDPTSCPLLLITSHSTRTPFLLNESGWKRRARIDSWIRHLHTIWCYSNWKRHEFRGSVFYRRNCMFLRTYATDIDQIDTIHSTFQLVYHHEAPVTEQINYWHFCLLNHFEFWRLLVLVEAAKPVSRSPKTKSAWWWNVAPLTCIDVRKANA